MFSPELMREYFSQPDNGTNWTQINNGLTTIQVSSLAISSSGNIFAGTYAGGVFLSTDNGTNWSEINNGLTNTYVYSLAINSNDHVFAGTWEGGVFLTTDNGGNWSQINNGLDSTDVLSLAINSIGYIFAGTYDGGIYLSTDNGANWTEINAGLAFISINSLAINSIGYVFAGTYGRGVFRSVQSTTSMEQIDNKILSSFVLEQNFPNPFNPNTTIQFQIPDFGFTTLKVYDVLGNEVATLVDEYQSAGEYEVEFVGDGLTSGIYFYQLIAGNFVQSKKMILLR